MPPSGRVRGTCREQPVLAAAVRVSAIIAIAIACSIVILPSVDTGVSQVLAASDAAEQVTVTLIADGRERSVTTEPVTVAELVAGARIALSELDRVEPGLDELVSQGLVVRVVRVTHQQVTREIEIPVTARVRYDARVHKPIVLHDGSPGRAVAVLDIWTKDGDETERAVVSQRVIEPMKPRLVVRGTRSLPSRGGEVLHMEATGYDPGPRSCGRYASGRTAIGLKAGKGVVAVDPRVIPLGTKLYVDGYGECVAGDVGRAIKGRRIDLGFDTYREALSWGRRMVKVRILE
ncbi:MAG: DUF348 domain-containing protein [Armatimonadota bacterium]|nr:MAG: DUF348 domain-containing protein [Armatimonadota bacterium]